MKVLLFTHKIDIDGMGCAVLGKLAFEDINIVYCDTFEINQHVQRFIDDASIYDYDKVYITDLCIKQPLLGEIDNNDLLKEKFQILDHHKSEIDEGNANYSFSKIIVNNDEGKCSGTSLFYEYLLNNNYLFPNPSINLFVELTRQYDTWEWKTIYNNEAANDLNISFVMMGLNDYVETMFCKLKNEEEIFDDSLKHNIYDYKTQLFNDCKNHISTMKTIMLKGFIIGVIDGVEDRCKNDIAEILKIERYKIDFVAMLISERNTISFRSVKPDIDVGKFAAMYGGKGHKEAGSCKQTKEILKDLQVRKNKVVIE